MDTHASRQAPGRTLADPRDRHARLRARPDDGHPGAGRHAAASSARRPAGITWMVTAYLLVASIATPILGRLGDMFGKERLLAISLALFAVGSVVCALSDSLGLMIVGRGLQGLGGGVFPLSLRDHPRRVPARARSRPASRCSARSRRSAPASASRSAACSSTGRATTGSSGSPRSWASLATITTILLRARVAGPHARAASTSSGAGILAVGLTALLIAISRGADWGWGSPRDARPDRRRPDRARRCSASSSARTPQPLVNMQTFARRPVLTTNISTLLIGSAMIGTFVLVPQLAQLPDGRRRRLRPLGHRGRPAARARQPRLAARRAVRRPSGRAPRLQAAVLRRLPAHRRRAARAWPSPTAPRR